MNARFYPLLMTMSRYESRCPTCLENSALPLELFSSAEEFLSSDCIDQTRCLILDIAMPGISGPELHQELKRCG